jgi:hypothetical protein
VSRYEVALWLCCQNPPPYIAVKRRLIIHMTNS